MHIINRFCYIFKKDPCKTCLVKPCCSEICEKKHLWNFYTWRETTKKHCDNTDIITVLYGIIYIIVTIVTIVVKLFGL